MRPDEANARGVSLIETLIAMAIVGLIVAVSVPGFGNLNRQRELTSASAEVRTIFREVRARAIASARNTAVKFKSIDGVWHYAIFVDGDGDGVRNDDINSGVDRPATPYRRVFGSTGRVHIGLPPVPVRDPDVGVVRPDDSPVRFNSSTLCSFSPIGGGTSGSIYLTDGVSKAAVVRVYGTTGKVRMAMLKAAK